MKKPKIMKDAVRLIKGEPLNMDERIEQLEKKLDLKIAHFEDSMTTLHETIRNLHRENKALREENSEMKKSFSERIESGSVSILGGIKERLIKPLVKDSEDFAEFVLDDDEKPMKNETPGPKFASKINEKGEFKNNKKPATVELAKNKTVEKKDLKDGKNCPQNKPATYNENYVKVEFVNNPTLKNQNIVSKDPLAQPELSPDMEIERNATDPRCKTAKWMRQKFGLSPEIQERRMKSKSRKMKKK